MRAGHFPIVQAVDLPIEVLERRQIDGKEALDHLRRHIVSGEVSEALDNTGKKKNDQIRSVSPHTRILQG